MGVYNMIEYSGRIIGSVGGIYTVAADSQTPLGRLINCRARGLFRHKNEKPLVGDFVLVTIENDDDPSSALISEILERKNSLIRPPLSNLDYIFVTLAASSPEPDPETADRLVAIAEFNRITPVIVIGKKELDREEAASLEKIYRLAGFDVFSLSCHTGEGIDSIRNFVEETLPGHTAAFAGASGTGKSTLMNLLFPELELETAGISRKTKRGRHTTRRVTLYPVLGGDDLSSCGFLADTPGFSLLDFERFDFFTKEDLPHTFREFSEHIGSCRFTKCSHTKEEGCAILNAMHEGKISESRHRSYVNIYGILKSKNFWEEK